MKRSSESGVALLSAILVLMLMSAILVGFIALVTSDQNASGITRDQTQAYAAAHAATEKLTTDLGQLFTNNFAPTGAQVQALATNARQPNLGNGTSYVSPAGGSGYVIEFDDLTGPNGLGGPDGNPDLENPTGSQITDGVYAGLMGLITPYRMTVTARTLGGSEVRMRREMQTVAIPVFQFGIFSENDLSFFAGPSFNFGGRIHTNQNLYLAQGSGNPAPILTISDRVTAVGEIVREFLSNGEDLGTPIPPGNNTYNGIVRIARASNCPTIAANCRDLAATEDSVVITSNPPTPPSVPVWVVGPPSRWEMQLRAGNTASPGWDNISRAQYNSWIRNGATGARRLDLPIVDASAGTTPIDLIRRPRAGDPIGPGTPFQERFYRLASIRILLSDTAGEINGLPGIGPGAAVDLSALVPGAGGYNGPGGAAVAAPPAASDAGVFPAGTTILTGWIKVERQLNDGVTWEDITMPILNLGIAGRNLSNGTVNTPDVNTCTNAEPFPNAVIRLQRVRDNPTNGFPCGITAPGPPRVASTRARDYWPNVLYDAREAARRDSDVPAAGQIYLGGVMHYVELDVNNLRTYLLTAGAANTMNTTGFVVYFSDRRGNKNAAVGGVETGEFGYEDIVNPLSATGAASGGAPDVGEDFNANGALEVYGDIPRLAGNAPLDATARLRTLVAAQVGRVNPPTFFRRALKLVNGGVGQLPANGSQGLTVASENPVYIQGNYNACGTSMADCAAGGFGNNPGVDHVSAAVIADTVTLLSRNWNDIRSFTSPHAPGGRPALETWYRLGVIAGKGLSFPRPAGGVNDPKDFGTDGGAHNFLRFLENWPGDLNYRGSLISLFTSRQATGVYKCCTIVYDPPDRQYNFDVEFLNPTLLPPRTPMFRDINTLTFRQVLRPTQ